MAPGPADVARRRKHATPRKIDVQACIDHLIAEHELPVHFSAGAISEAASVPSKVSASDIKGRRDLTRINLVTIDGVDAKDFDDAVHCAREADEFVLTVAIADVGHYVAADSALDRSAAERGNSVYFPGRVLPMLPERLSNGICSLVPREERLALCCEARIGFDGKLRNYELFEGVMRSAERFTYDKVAAILDGKEGHALAPMLRDLDALCDALLADRLERGGLDIDLPEVVPIVKGGDPVGFKELRRLKSHRVIEECMLIANICAADFVKSRKIKSLYRVHPDPEFAKIERLRATLANRGINVSKKPTAQDLVRAMRLADNLGPLTGRAFKMAVLQSLAKAIYTPTSSGHFGLAYENYTHFTSPIRRYPDLLVHRDIKACLRGGRASPKRDLKAIGEHCTQTEMRADRASWNLKSMLGCIYLEPRIGEEFDAVVTGVTEFGVFVEAEPHRLDGLIHVASLGEDYFIYDSARHRLVGRRNGRAFAVGDTIRVLLEGVQIEKMKTAFSLARAA